MSRKPQEFTLEDSEGNTHVYSVIPHKGTEAVGLVWQIMHGALGPVGRLMDSNTGILIDLLTGEVDGDGIIELLRTAKTDFKASVDDVFAVIAVSGEEKFTRELLSHTYRDGKLLKNSSHFDEAFTANSGEMVQAMWLSIKVNNFLGLLRSLLGSFVEVNEVADARPMTESAELPDVLGSTG